MMLAGEYSVVTRGGACVSVAVGPGVDVSFEPDEGPFRLTSQAVGLENADPAAVPLIAHVLDALESPRGGLITVESRLGAGETKPGLGASAAVTIAIVGAVYTSMGRGLPTLREVTALHQLAQGGLGSGYDAATSLVGGVIVFSNSASGPEAQQLAWPDGLFTRAISTGIGSSSRTLLKKKMNWARHQPRLNDRHEARMMSATNLLIDAWRSGNTRAVLTCLADCQESLAAMEKDASLGLFDNRLGELLSCVDEAGAIGRVSGAGGGDSAWVCSDDLDCLERAVASAEKAGFKTLALDFPADGLELLVEG
jgi:phosphomevalonate kinase